MSSRLVFSPKAHTYSLDGQRVPSVSAIKGVLDKAALPWAAARETAAWAAAHAHELAQLGEATWREAAIRAHREVWDAKRDDGTRVHTIAEALVFGEPVPEVDADGVPWSDDVRLMGEQVARFMDRWDVEPVLVEVPVFHEEQRYAGKPDLLADLRDGARWLIDYKTGTTGPYQEVALQLSGYRNCTHVALAEHDEPMPEVERLGVLWVRPDGWELLPIDVTDTSWRVFLACKFILENYASLSREQVVLAALPVPEVGAA